MMDPTVYRISALLDLLPFWTKANVVLTPTEARYIFSLDVHNKPITAYSFFLAACCGRDGSLVLDQELISFLLYWIN